MSGHVLERSVIEAPTLPVSRPPGPIAAPRPKRMRGRWLAWSGAGVLLLAGIGWLGHDWWTVGRFIESTDDAYVGGDVTVLAPKISGFISMIAVADNQAVHAGDLLVALDDRDYRAALAKADAGVALQQATLANVAAERRLQEANIDEARAALVSTEAELVRSRSDLDRYRSLSRDQFASIQRFQQADADHQKALGAHAGARAALDAAIRQLDVIDTRQTTVEAALQAAIADRETARLMLSYTQLRAPVDGTIGNRSARLGAFATPGAQLLSLIPARGLWVDANFKESQLRNMRPGMVVEIEADAIPGKRFEGHVDSIAPASGAIFSVLPAENATGNFTKIVQRVPVRVRLDGDAERLGLFRPGLSVTASVDERTGPTGLAP